MDDFYQKLLQSNFSWHDFKEKVDKKQLNIELVNIWEQATGKKVKDVTG